MPMEDNVCVVIHGLLSSHPYGSSGASGAAIHPFGIAAVTGQGGRLPQTCSLQQPWRSRNAHDGQQAERRLNHRCPETAQISASIAPCREYSMNSDSIRFPLHFGVTIFWELRLRCEDYHDDASRRSLHRDNPLHERLALASNSSKLRARNRIPQSVDSPTTESCNYDVFRGLCCLRVFFAIPLHRQRT
jgi:hypothetical protein